MAYRRLRNPFFGGSERAPHAPDQTVQPRAVTVNTSIQRENSLVGSPPPPYQSPTVDLAEESSTDDPPRYSFVDDAPRGSHSPNTRQPAVAAATTDRDDWPLVTTNRQTSAPSTAGFDSSNNSGASPSISQGQAYTPPQEQASSPTRPSQSQPPSSNEHRVGPGPHQDSRSLSPTIQSSVTLTNTSTNDAPAQLSASARSSQGTPLQFNFPGSFPTDVPVRTGPELAPTSVSAPLNSASPPLASPLSSTMRPSSASFSESGSSSNTSYTTLRLENLPSNTTRESAQALFVPSDHYRIDISSLAPAVTVVEGEEGELVATVLVSRTLQQSNTTDSNTAETTETAGHLQSTPRLLFEDVGSLDSDFRDLTPLAWPRNPVADVVAVAGFTSHPFSVWQSRPTHMWLRDSLPRDFPNVNVMIFGYKPRLDRSDVLQDVARKLTQRLKKLPGSDNAIRRPLVLIGHSTGCLIIKKALVELQKSTQENIAERISCIVFMGAPHKGLDSMAIQTIIAPEPSNVLLAGLDQQSQVLQDLDDSFRALADSVPILSCCEDKETRVASGQMHTIVSIDNATLGTTNETQLEYEHDHLQLAKCDRNSMIYKDIRDHLRKEGHVRPIPQARGSVDSQYSVSPLIGADAPAGAPTQTLHLYQSPSREQRQPSPVAPSPAVPSPIGPSPTGPPAMRRETRYSAQFYEQQQQQRTQRSFSLSADSNTGQAGLTPSALLFTAPAQPSSAPQPTRPPPPLPTFQGPGYQTHEIDTRTITRVQMSAIPDPGIPELPTIPDPVEMPDQLPLNAQYSNGLASPGPPAQRTFSVDSSASGASANNLSPPLAQGHWRSESNSSNEGRNRPRFSSIFKANSKKRETQFYDPVAFVRAVRDADIGHVTEFLKVNVDINAQDPEDGGRTALHMAARLKDIQRVNLLLDHKPKPKKDVKASSGETALHEAARVGSIPVLTALLAARICDTETKANNGATALHVAAEMGHKTVCRELLDNYAVLEAKRKDGKTPLQLSIDNNHVEVRKFLERRITRKNAPVEHPGLF